MTSHWSDPSALGQSAASDPARRPLLTPADVTARLAPAPAPAAAASTATSADPLPSTAFVEAWLSGCVPGRGGTETPSTRVESTPAADATDADEVRSTKSDSVCYQLQPIGVFWDIENCQVRDWAGAAVLGSARGDWDWGMELRSGEMTIDQGGGGQLEWGGSAGSNSGSGLFLPTTSSPSSHCLKKRRCLLLLRRNWFHWYLGGEEVSRGYL